MEPDAKLPPGTYKFTVKSAEQAVALIRQRLGPTAKVLSVRPILGPGLTRWFKCDRLEIIASVDPAAVPAPKGTTFSAVSSAPATPVADVVPAEPSRLQPPRAGSEPMPRTDATSPELAMLLQKSGITPSALQRLQAHAQWSELAALPLHRALAETSRLLRSHVETRPSRGPISRAAFLGCAGVGRTTALCKWLAQETFKRAKCGHVVSVEFDRPNPLGPLPVFAEAMGVPLAPFPCETRPVLPGAFVYFDVPSLSIDRPADNRRLAEFLDTEKVHTRVLVLNAAYDRASLRAAYAAGRDLGATHLVFTHLDEVPQWGKLWDYLFDANVEPLFLATGSSLTGDIEEDVAAAIARKTLPSENQEEGA